MNGSGGTSATTKHEDASSASGGAPSTPTADGSFESGVSEAGALIPLPAGSREIDGIVNLVDADAAAELESFLTDQKQIFLTLRHGLNKSLNLFLEHYEENYDFVYIFTDHAIAGVPEAGVFEPVTRPAGPGGVSEYEIRAEGYETTGRVKGVIGIPYGAVNYPPLLHETAHYWAVYLDDRFGFGDGFDASSSAPLHWGYASINGQLGGFDGSTLRCETPAGAMPPACTGQSGGRTRYVLGPFGASANAFRGIPYAPMELYLMGLATGSEVPASITLLTKAKVATSSATSVTVEASGVSTLQFSTIVARHGTPKLLPSNQRGFSGAFVVVSAAPAADSVLNDVAGFAAGFGNRKAVSGWPSFEDATGGRATMNTELGARRAVGNAPPPPRAPLTCDIVKQDCDRPELGCYMEPPAVCALSGGVKLDQPCDATFACARGLDCVAGKSTPNTYVCKPYCDPNSGTSASSCAKLCPSNYVTFQDSSAAIVGAICLPN